MTLVLIKAKTSLMIKNRVLTSAEVQILYLISFPSLSVFSKNIFASIALVFVDLNVLLQKAMHG